MNLGARYWRFSRKAASIAEAFQHATLPLTDPGCEVPHALARENALIQLQDQWSSFCRDLIVASWQGGVTTLGGTVISKRQGSNSASAAMVALRSTYTGRSKKSRYWEPKWFDPAETIEAAGRLKIPNLASVSGGIGISPAPLGELRAARNYFAHRGQESTQRLASYISGPITDTAAHAHVTRLTLGGVPAFVRWAAEMDSMARASAI